ncbi:hypothetical protein B0T22DRAFT_470506 [Podospora appendiculata]|uniref:Uncharacterized protein n=1 Tax=Podospora appendiculata TaxID=314037 RepID=A0AAE0X0G8_9PEZI|nr:hypothetical protein B0T22DRAFT_470506 [Podospora appendiculata]
MAPPSKRASLCVNMGSEQRTESIHDLDMKYQHSTHKSNLLAKDEEARRIKLRSMLIRDENTALKEQLAQKDNCIKTLIDQVDDVRAQLDSVQQKSARQEKLMQTQAREISNLKEELSALSSVTQDSGKVLSEKLALSREVAVLKPEIDHLRSQLAHQKDVLAEKLALERQLNAIEVELANEKRAAQKAAQKQEQENKEEAELQKQLRDLEKQHAKEKKAAQKSIEAQEVKTNKMEEELQSLREQLAASEKRLTSEKRKAAQAAESQDNTSEMEEELEQLRHALAETEKALAAEKRNAERKATKQDSKSASAADAEVDQLRQTLAEQEKALKEEKKEKDRLLKENGQIEAEAEARQEASNEKLAKSKAKLREVQQELKQAQADLEQAREHSVTIPAARTMTVPVKKAAAKGPAKKKRSAEEALEDVLHTPSNTDDRPKRPLKKRGFESTLGEKSTFSITPFLNKTINLADGSPKSGAKFRGDDPTRALPLFQVRGAEDATMTAAVDVDGDSPPTKPQATGSSSKPSKANEKKPRGRPKAAPLAESSVKKNLAARGSKTARAETTLESLAEEEAEEAVVNPGQENRSMEGAEPTRAVESKTKTSEPQTNGVSTISLEAEPKKKKRKLLGTSNKPTIFEEDEGERVTVAAKRPPKAGLNAARGVGRVAALGGAKSAFGASFSPLKRDRRGVNASFLA